ncbi:MAG: zinc-dependent metalloprotease [Actinomycetota bacterium]|nr:zinc-dependent metalloprotease [Actinomycetota bacterium]
MQWEIALEKMYRFLEKLGIQLFSPSESLINWEVATGIAFDLSDTGTKAPFDRESLMDAYCNMLEMVRPKIADYVGNPWTSTDLVCVFDRTEWIVMNMGNIKSLLKPLAKSYWEALQTYLSSVYPGGKVLRKVGQISITTEIGLMMGHLSTKVLAQYDFGLPTAEGVFPERFLYFVEPNIVNLERELNLDPFNLRLWIVLHESTHSFQFHVHPWLRDYLNSLLKEYLALANKAVSQLELEILRGSRPLSWSQFWWKHLLGPEHRELAGRIQALMCLIEGYSEHVMVEVGRQLPDYDKLLAVFRERRKRKSLFQLILEKLIGLDIKLKQYILGERFVSYVVKSEGVEFLNRIWDDRDNLPTWREIYYPDEWISRIKSSS